MRDSTRALQLLTALSMAAKRNAPSDTSSGDLVGHVVTKYFAGHAKPFSGRVTRRTGNHLWHVLYEDGEELSTSEIKELGRSGKRRPISVNVRQSSGSAGRAALTEIAYENVPSPSSGVRFNPVPIYNPVPLPSPRAQ